MLMVGGSGPIGLAQNAQPAQRSQAAQSSAGAATQAVPTFQVSSKLVYLDVTVLDRKNHPVVSGLTKDDFLITEDKRPQTIFSFEPPDAHTLSSDGQNPAGKAPVTILVLDQLNSRFQDFAYIRWEANRYLQSQPKELPSPTELMIVGQNSLELVQSFTRDRGELEEALQHIPAALPYKQMLAAFGGERIQQSFDALEQIALACQGIPGRKNVLWLGVGGPGVNTLFLPAGVSKPLLQYAHSVTNMMVDARMTLFVMYPGLRVHQAEFNPSTMDSTIDLPDNDPFGPTGQINFGLFANETGGELFYNRNDVDGEMKEAEVIGSAYYTLTYQPHGGDDDGRFRRIRVTMRDPNLHVVTKAGYYAADKSAPADPMEQRMQSMAEAVQATVPYTNLQLHVSDVLRHPDSQSVEVILQVFPKDLNWTPSDDGTSSASLLVASAAMNRYRDILRGRMRTLNFTAHTQDQSVIAQQLPLIVDVTIPAPRKKTQFVRVAVETEHGGRLGTAEFDRAMLEKAPAAPTAQPRLAGPRAVRPASLPPSP